MRKNFGPKPILYPMPVFIIATYDQDGVPNAMNAAWGGICGGSKITMYLKGTRKTVANMIQRGAFTVSMGTADQVIACDYVGIVSASAVPDKFTRAGFHAVKSEFVDAPLIQELPMALECKLIRYDGESSCLVGEIVNVCADESVLTDGFIDPAKLQPITYDEANHTYHVLGEIVGYAFQDGTVLK